jgi:hypothetical protein
VLAMGDWTRGRGRKLPIGQHLGRREGLLDEERPARGGCGEEALGPGEVAFLIWRPP